MATTDYHINQMVWFRSFFESTLPVQDRIVKIKNNRAITMENRVIDMETNQWIEPQRNRYFVPGQVFLKEEDAQKREITVIKTRRLLKTNRGYLYNVWDGNEFRENFNFTSNPVEACDFTPFKDDEPNQMVPRTTLNLDKDHPITTLEEASKYTGGKFVDVTITVQTTWSETDYNPN